MTTTLRQRLVSDRLFSWAKQSLPTLSKTEREALEAGDVWWDGELFSGRPDWNKLSSLPPARLSADEQAFLDGPVATLCAMLDDWRINSELLDLPPDVWAYLKAQKFFGMIVPKTYGGLGFSAAAHSEVIKRISTRSTTAAVTVMVPNSLGPGELLVRFGTEEQKAHYLPRLADGREIPCFGLTSNEAGSDAASMIDRGVVCRGTHKGERILGMHLTWSKRYITLAPVATLLGLAFKLYDPEHLLGDEEELGITVALVPADTPGAEFGRRHWPGLQAFQNGPTTGRDVFLPLDAIIGGRAQAGKGWKMLMSALAAGRGISLPSLATAAACASAYTAGAYTRVREQFGIPISKFEGVEERLGRIAGTAYMLEAARRLTCAGLDQGHRPAIVSAIMKAHATEHMRVVVNDSMDVHGGKGICDGPLNYLGNVYRAIPIGITVEGSNILTRSLIIFGQGAIRCHPHLLDEIRALESSSEEEAKAAFDKALWRHVGHMLATFGRATVGSWSGALLSPAPGGGDVRHHYRRASRYAAGLAFASEVALVSLGGALKRLESISARLGDVLSELYLVSAVLKRYNDEGEKSADLPLVDWACEASFARIERALDGVVANFPSRLLGFLIKAVVLPWGIGRRGPSDETVGACAALILSPQDTRNRLTTGVYVGSGDGALARLARAFALVHETAPLERKLEKADIAGDWEAARARGIVTDADMARLEETERAVHEAIVVDDFAPEFFAIERRKETRSPRDLKVVPGE